MSLTIEELIDQVNQELTVGCMLPKILPDLEIRRIISQRAAPYFYRNYRYAVIKGYYMVPKSSFTIDADTGYRAVVLPEEIVNVTWIYPTNSPRLLQLGFNAPNLAINTNTTNAAILSPTLSTIGELGVYKVVIDGFADMLNQLTKTTYKYHFNQNNHRLHFLTSWDDIQGSNAMNSIVLECYIKIECDALYCDELFQRYVTALSKQQLANLLGRYNFNLPGGIQFNISDIRSEAEKEMQEVRDEIKAMSTVTFFRMIKR